jgi:Peroxidase, family 2
MAPIRPSRTLIRALLADSASGTHLTLPDLARARLRRSATTGPSPPHLSHFSDAECALAIAVLGRDVYGDAPSVPLGVLKEWLEEERLPAGWRPGGVMGLWREHLNTARVQELMANKRKYRHGRKDVRTVVME